MKKYPKYKPSGVEWIGEIPEYWDMKKIKHCCYVKDRVGWNGLKASEFLVKGFAYLITGTDFKNGLVDWNNCYNIDEERYNEDPFIQLKNEDLLITKDGTIGKLAIVAKLDKPACLNSGIFVVRSLLQTFSTRYLYWILRSNVFKNFNEYTSYGSTIQHLYQNVFVEFNYCFPTFLEQTAIANFLDEKTAQIDKLITNKQKLIELLKEERTAVINQAVTRGINSNVKLKDSGIEWLGKIPEHWEVKKLKYVAKKIQTGSTPPSSQEEYYQEEINWFTPSDFSDDLLLTNSRRKISESAIDDDVVKLFPKNSVLIIGIGATLGKVGYIIEEASSNQQINSISFDSFIDAKYYANFFFVNKLNIVSLANAATLAILNQSQTKDIVVPVPKEEDMILIVQNIDTETKRIDGTISKIEKEIELLAEYRTALISEVVTGKIKVIDN